MTSLVIAEHDNASIKARTLNTVTAALACGGDVHVLVAGANAGAAAAAAAQIAGVSQGHPRRRRAGSPWPGRERRRAGAGHRRATATSCSPPPPGGKNVAPRVAAKLDVAQISDITKVISRRHLRAPDLRRQRHRHGAERGRHQGHHRAHHRLRPAAPRAAVPPSKPSRCGRQRQEHLPGQRDRQERPPRTDRAKIVVSGGRALGSSEKFNEVMTPLADKLGAAMGASRAAVDAGYAPNDWQVGQTGKIVAPQLYIAAGISGAIQHLAGMKDSKVIVAINKDPEAPIFSVADYGLEADLFVAVPELGRAVKRSAGRVPPWHRSRCRSPVFGSRISPGDTMSYIAPVKDMLFNMKHLARIDQVAQLPGFEDAGLDTAQAVLEECAKFNEGVIAPLNWEGDKNPSSFKDGKVTTTPGFKEAFRSTPKAAGRACSIRWPSAARACPRPSARPAARCSTAPT
jgi:electron transfer flavoprotein alpha subunit